MENSRKGKEETTLGCCLAFLPIIIGGIAGGYLTHRYALPYIRDHTAQTSIFRGHLGYGIDFVGMVCGLFLGDGLFNKIFNKSKSEVPDYVGKARRGEDLSDHYGERLERELEERIEELERRKRIGEQVVDTLLKDYIEIVKTVRDSGVDISIVEYGSEVVNGQLPLFDVKVGPYSSGPYCRYEYYFPGSYCHISYESIHLRVHYPQGVTETVPMHFFDLTKADERTVLHSQKDLEDLVNALIANSKASYGTTPGDKQIRRVLRRSGWK